jgi:Dolichyl-phosphate-mannose-protein mannosyltransferase
VKAKANTLAAVLVGALFVASVWLRLRALQSSPYPTGIDGYWYLIQVRSLLEHGRLYYPSAPLVPWLMAAVAELSGPLLALKIVAACASAALVIPSYLVAKRICGATGPALLGTALAATSAQSFYLCTEFVKQSAGLSLALGFAAALGWALERRRPLPVLATSLLLVACALTHKTALALALIVALPPVLAHVWSTRGRTVALACLGCLAVVGLAVAWAVRQHLEPLAHLFTRHANFSLAVLAGPGPTPLVLGHEVALAFMLASLVLVQAALRKPEQGARIPALAVGFVVFALVQGLPWLHVADDQGLGYRLRLCACFCLAPCAALVAAQLARWARPTLRALLLTLVFCLVLALRPWTSEQGVVKAHPAMVEAASRLAGVLPPDAMVIVPERHTAFMATWYARLNARLQPPLTIDAGRTYRLLPGAEIQPGLWAALDELRAHPVDGVAPSLDLHSLHPNGLVLLAEPTYQYLLARLPAPERKWYEAWVVQ